MGNTTAQTSYNITINEDLSLSGVSLDGSSYSLEAGPGTRITFLAPSGWKIVGFERYGPRVQNAQMTDSSFVIDVGLVSSPVRTEDDLVKVLLHQDGSSHQVKQSTMPLYVRVGPVKAITAQYSGDGDGPSFSYEGDVILSDTAPPAIELTQDSFVGINLVGAAFDSIPVQWDDRPPGSPPAGMSPFVASSSMAVFYDEVDCRGTYHFVLRYTLPPDTTVYTSDDPTIVNKDTSGTGG